MNKNTALLALIVVCGFAWPVIVMGADKIPPLLKVSPRLPAAERQAFQQRSAELEADLKDFIEASGRFNRKPAQDQSDQEFAELTARRARYVTAAKQFNAGLTACMLALDAGDPMVVDARDVPSGLPKAIEDAIPHTPAGARVRKGFQAVTVHDWKVALAWFQDALNHEPGDPGLQRLVDLAHYTLQRRSEPAARPPDGATAATMEKLGKLLESGMSEELNRSLQDYREHAPGPKEVPPRSNISPVAEVGKSPTAPTPPTSVQGEQGFSWKAFADSLFKPLPKGKPPQVSAPRD